MSAVPLQQSQPLLEVDAVCLRYGRIEVLKDVSLQVQQGETFAIIGPNGAGKTSLFRVMTGEAPCYAGSVRYGGQDVTTLPAFRRTRLGMGRTFQVARVFQDFTALDNVVVAIEARERSARRGNGPWWAWRPAKATVSEAEALLNDLGLKDRRHEEAKFLSHGDKKRLEMAVALALQPKVLMLDEPTAGMAPSDRMGTAELIGRLQRERGITVVMTEHDMDVVFGLAHRLMVLNYGQVVASGSVAEVRANPMVQEVYLGKEMVGA
ncbi:MAG: ABC transporter ATP-binding protein [Burkholderiales bacterium]